MSDKSQHNDKPGTFKLHNANRTVPDLELAHAVGELTLVLLDRGYPAAFVRGMTDELRGEPLLPHPSCNPTNRPRSWT